jgi:CRISPR system Cascade subunit CasA
MSFDLRRESWIPWRYRSGGIRWGPIAAVAEEVSLDNGNWVVAPAWPRPDFDAALQEFLVGLLGFALFPRDEAAWLALWRKPPTVEELQHALDNLPAGFEIDGDGPRAFQDLSANDLADVEGTSIEQLLIESPGEQTMKLNKDLFVGRGRIERLGRPAAAMALITMQTYAPSGGQGHRTSARGGGPLTTLVDPRVDKTGSHSPLDQPLWFKLWANVLPADEWKPSESASKNFASDRILPWLAPTRVSDSAHSLATTPSDAHPLQAYFGLPRRIRLEFGDAGKCDLTGRDDQLTVVEFRMRNYGVKYENWQHPLSPHYKDKKDEWLPLHGQPGGVAWRDWAGLTMETPEVNRQPAQVVANFGRRARALKLSSYQVHAFGFDMDNMKARGWVESNVPSYGGLNPEHQNLVLEAARRLANAVGVASTALLDAVKVALFDRAKDAPGDWSAVKAELWDITERSFYDFLRAMAEQHSTIEALNARCAEFAPALERVTVEIFDRWSHDDRIPVGIARRVVGARFSLVMALRGRSKLGAKLFDALGIAQPETPPKKPRAAKQARKEKKS